jgi:hypothetical protein
LQKIDLNWTDTLASEGAEDSNNLMPKVFRNYSMRPEPSPVGALIYSIVKFGFLPDLQPKASGIKWLLPTACLPIYSFAFWCKPFTSWTFRQSLSGKNPVM